MARAAGEHLAAARAGAAGAERRDDAAAAAGGAARRVDEDEIGLGVRDDTREIAGGRGDLELGVEERGVALELLHGADAHRVGGDERHGALAVDDRAGRDLREGRGLADAGGADARDDGGALVRERPRGDAHERGERLAEALGEGGAVRRHRAEGGGDRAGRSAFDPRGAEHAAGGAAEVAVVHRLEGRAEGGDLGLHRGGGALLREGVLGAELGAEGGAERGEVAVRRRGRGLLVSREREGAARRRGRRGRGRGGQRGELGLRRGRGDLEVAGAEPAHQTCPGDRARRVKHGSLTQRCLRCAARLGESGSSKDLGGHDVAPCLERAGTAPIPRVSTTRRGVEGSISRNEKTERLGRRRSKIARA